jgi:hypothetical protein
MHLILKLAQVINEFLLGLMVRKNLSSIFSRNKFFCQQLYLSRNQILNYQYFLLETRGLIEKWKKSQF